MTNVNPFSGPSIDDYFGHSKEEKNSNIFKKPSFETICQYFGIDPETSTWSDYRKAYKRKANEVHPDKNPEASTEEFQRAQTLYETYPDEDAFNEAQFKNIFGGDRYQPRFNQDESINYLEQLFIGRPEDRQKAKVTITQAVRNTYKNLFKYGQLFTDYAVQKLANGEEKTTIQQPGLDLFYETLLASKLRLPRQAINGDDLVQITERELANCATKLHPNNILNKFRFLDLTYQMANRETPENSKNKLVKQTTNEIVNSARYNPRKAGDTQAIQLINRVSALKKTYKASPELISYLGKNFFQQAGDEVYNQLLQDYSDYKQFQEEEGMKVSRKNVLLAKAISGESYDTSQFK